MNKILLIALSILILFIVGCAQKEIKESTEIKFVEYTPKGCENITCIMCYEGQECQDIMCGELIPIDNSSVSFGMRCKV